MNPIMNEYQSEQWEALLLARRLLARQTVVQADRLKKRIEPYLEFRGRVDQFLNIHFGDHCTQSCYTNRRSACCSKDGIIVFWADVVINVLCSDDALLADLEQALLNPFQEYKCIYLGAQGCRWRVRPLGCAMFLCDPVRAAVFQAGNAIEGQWMELQQRAQDFRWPNKPVLFDDLETYFLELGGRSSLMHINYSPGLLRIKRQAGLCSPKPHQKP
jgi:hypothetical protein